MAAGAGLNGQSHNGSPMTPPAEQSDVLLVGAGLANALIALFLTRAQPQLTIIMIDRDARVGGNHTWSFHSTDVDAEALNLLKPMLEAHWPDQEIWFPKLKRVLKTGYNSITSDHLHDYVSQEPRIKLVLSADVVDVGATQVTLADGRTFAASCVIDGRGARKSDALVLGYQKFVGLEVELDEPHGRTRPIIMDATVDQHDGYRFVYTLPFSPTRILIEDTYYSDGPELAVDALTKRTEAYAEARNWRIKDLVRKEQGILPITLAGDIEAFWSETASPAAQAGMRAALFHPTTGYSLPDAVLLAQRVASANELTTASIDQLVRTHSTECWDNRSFFRFLNRMLFLAARGEERRDVLERFYSLPQPLIERFYAARIKPRDKARILLGRPPLPIGRAVRYMPESSARASAS